MTSTRLALFVIIQITRIKDVDSDFATVKKELVKDHFAHVYGEKCTASIGTCGLMKTKSVLKDLARLYEVPMEEINDVTAGEMRSYMDDDENPMPLEKLKEMFPGLDALLQKYPQMGKTFEKLRGSITNWGKHAGGVLITDFDLTEQVPVRRDNEGKLVTCWQEGIAARELGQMGFIKFDILAIDQLNIFEHTIQLIKETTGKEIKIDDIPLGDYKALSQMNEHDSVCVFQFDTDLCPRVVDHMKGIHTFEDLGSLSTLMRPAALSNKFDTEFGKRRQNSKNIYIPDCLKPYLGPTFGLPIYQEHIMQAGMYLADMNKKDAYKFMKLLYKGKMTKDLIPYWKEKFLNGCKSKIDAGEVKSDYPETLFNQLLAFQGYGFPKCLSLDTVVEKEDGYEIFGDLKVGDRIKAPNENFEDEFVEVKNIWDSEKDLYEITLENGLTIKSSLEHKFLCPDGEMRPLKEIIENDFEIVSE